MRSFVGWLVWMLILLAAALNPDVVGKGLETASQAPFAFVAIFIVFYVIVIIPSLKLIQWDTAKTMKAQYKGKINTLEARLGAEEKENQRKEAQVAELKEQLKEFISTEVSSPKNTIEPISVVTISDKNDDGIKLLFGNSSLDTFSPQELKVKALQTANGIYKIVESVESNIPIGRSDIAATVFLGISSEPSVIPKRQPPILSSALNDYRNKYHDIAIELKSKIAGNNNQKYLSAKHYTNPDCLNDLKAIADDLRLLSDD